MKKLKHIKLFENFQLIKEEWFPQDIYLVPLDKSNTSILEFYGSALVEITNRNRRLDLLIDSIKEIIEDPNSVNEFFKGQVLAGSRSTEKRISRSVKAFAIQIENKSEIDIIEKELSQYGNFKMDKFYSSDIYILILNEPLLLQINTGPIR